MDENELTAAEIRALAAAFPVGQPARTLLRLMRFPAELIPSMDGRTALQFWAELADLIAMGAVSDGRRRLLGAAQGIYPGNSVFSGPGPDVSPATVTALSPTTGTAVAPPERTPVRRAGTPTQVRVLVIGASPSDMPPVRADREARAIAEAAPTLLKAESALGAEATDLEKVREFRPDILHFACHGDDDCLIFNTVLGESDPVLASRIAQTLAYYRANSGVRLRAIVLGACDGGKLAPEFTGVADTVIAHRKALSDPCGVAFARQFYRLVGGEASIAAAAREAAQLTAQYSEPCAAIIANLIVLGAGA